MAISTTTACMVQNYDLEGALTTLRKGGLILYPTDTIWSIGCDATNTFAIEKILSLKRGASYPGIEILVDSVQMLKSYVRHLHPRIETLLTYHVQPLTVLFDNPHNIPHNALDQEGNMAIRIVQDDYCRDLIEAFGKPLVATYANVASQPIPSNFGAISSEIIQGVDYVTKYRQHEKIVGSPSVMVQLSERDELLFLRE